mmetsp:Transcript_709/g.4557  ORF Transcript_709/g.4557 Transcript_709/m.4557 type:complete len:234 (+) Transcript_709:657-1358(+)
MRLPVPSPVFIFFQHVQLLPHLQRHQQQHAGIHGRDCRRHVFVDHGRDQGHASKHGQEEVRSPSQHERIDGSVRGAFHLFLDVLEGRTSRFARVVLGGAMDALEEQPSHELVFHVLFERFQIFPVLLAAGTAVSYLFFHFRSDAFDVCQRRSEFQLRPLLVQLVQLVEFLVGLLDERSEPLHLLFRALLQSILHFDFERFGAQELHQHFLQAIRFVVLFRTAVLAASRTACAR